ncbi:uncharacterized protein LOC129272961 isoform X1 [Lytechinus pictus]|uniref:uncharacterized protein LOC129272961 isoform X1 n=2 Tax=Lytechinus pictus TaxID=7653 RepID=UPI0030B9E924
MARDNKCAARTVRTDVASGYPKDLSTFGRSPTAKMLQPEMSNMPMSAMSREMTTRGSGRLHRVRENENEDMAEIKKGHSDPGVMTRVVRAVVPHLALMAIFFLYLAFGAWVFFMLENDCSLKCQMELQEAKMKMMDIAANRTLCNPSGSTALPPQDARGRMTSPSGRDGNDNVVPSESSEVCDDMMEEMDEHFDAVMKKMVRSGMTVGKMDSILVGRTWNLTSAMLFSMTTITTIGKFCPCSIYHPYLKLQTMRFYRFLPIRYDY